MYHKCAWCKTRINFQPIYYTQGFLQLKPGFEVYCNATCSLFAYGSDPKIQKSIQNTSPRFKFDEK